MSYPQTFGLVCFYVSLGDLWSQTLEIRAESGHRDSITYHTRQTMFKQHILMGPAV